MTPYELAYEYALHTNKSIFLTGKAGTGKTTLLRTLRTECPKQMMVVAPTGVAAIHAEGVTIHSLFQLPPQLFLPTPAARRQLFKEIQMRSHKRRLLQNLELLVIDEVSMVRADLLDAIDAILRNLKHRQHLPFGGVQMLFIGDLYQLSPVAREEEWNYLREYYQGPYFFQARVFQEITPVYIELDHVFRQTNRRFIDLLNEVRTNSLSRESLALLNSRYVPDWKQREGEPFHIILATHNRKVDAINKREIEALQGEAYTYEAHVEGTFPESMYPMEATLTLKEGARVMFIKTDSSPEKQYYNGKLGVVVQIDKDNIVVECVGEEGEPEQIAVHAETWENIRYVSRENSDEIETEVTGTFTHIPLRLAWAVTIHKAQGLTFDEVVIDAVDAFAAGQVYVALSRCRSLEGIVLLSRIPETALTNAREVLDFTSSQPTREIVETGLSLSQREYFIQIISGLYDFRDVAFRIESLQRLASSSTAFNKETADVYLTQLGHEVGGWQGTAAVFQRQIRQIVSAEEVDWGYLAQRLQAANGYFMPRMAELLKTLQASPVYSDDNEDAKAYEEQIEELYVGVMRQSFVMEKVGQTPTITAYFAARQAFTAPRVRISARSEQKTATSETTQHPQLLQRLFAMRSVLAEVAGYKQSPYLIAQTKTLIAISNSLPTTKKELLAISGVGKKRYEVIGEHVLRLVRQYIAEQQEPRQTEVPEEEEPTVSPREAREAAIRGQRQTSSAMKTLQLFYAGTTTIAELAKARKLSRAKIAEQLADLLEHGILHQSDLSSDDRDEVADILQARG